jgi:integrase
MLAFRGHLREAYRTAPAYTFHWPLVWQHPFPDLALLGTVPADSSAAVFGRMLRGDSLLRAEGEQRYGLAWWGAVRDTAKAVVVRPQLLGRIPHDFRRSACRRLIQNRIPEQIAMRLTGWRSRAMLDRYFVTNDRDLADAVSKVAALRATPAKPIVVPLRAEA